MYCINPDTHIEPKFVGLLHCPKNSCHHLFAVLFTPVIVIFGPCFNYPCLLWGLPAHWYSSRKSRWRDIFHIILASGMNSTMSVAYLCFLNCLIAFSIHICILKGKPGKDGESGQPGLPVSLLHFSSFYNDFSQF